MCLRSVEGVRYGAVHGGVRTPGVVAVAVEMEAVAVEAEAGDPRGEQVEGGEAILEAGEAAVVPEDLASQEGPEVVFGEAELLLAERRQVPEDTDEEAGVDELGEEGGVFGEQDGPDLGRHGAVLGEWHGAGVDVIDEVLDGEPDRYVVVVEDDDGVLAVRGENSAVLVEEVQQRREQGSEKVTQPDAGLEAGPVDQLGGEGSSLRVGVEEGGKGAGAFAGGELRVEGFAPDAAEEFFVLVRDAWQAVVEGVFDSDGGDFAEQDDAGFVAEEGVGVSEAVHPCGDGRRGDGAFGGEPAPDEGVEDRERQLDGVTSGLGGVDEGADGLLGQP